MPCRGFFLEISARQGKSNDILSVYFFMYTFQLIRSESGPIEPLGDLGSGDCDCTCVNGTDGKDGKDGQSIVGPQGPPGPPGQQGRPGFNGTNGKDGKDGAQGPKVCRAHACSQ